MRTILALVFSFVVAVHAEGKEPVVKPAEIPEVLFDRATPDIFPKVWRGGKIDAKAEPLAEEDKERSEAAVDRALALYPEELLKSYLKKVYVVGQLGYHGVATGGTRSSSSVYLVVNERYSTELAEKNLHAEFSSILFLKCPQHFDEVAWRAINPSDFTYRGSGVQAVKEGRASNLFKEDLHAIGFLNDYSQASVEEDFNGYAGRLLVGDAQLWSAMERYPKVKAKAVLAMTFYGKLDSKFTTGFFDSLRRPDASQLTLQRIFTDKDLEEEKLETLVWSKVGPHYFALEKPSEGTTGKDLVKHETVSGEITLIATAKELTPPDAEKPLKVTSFAFSKDESQVLLFTDTKKVWRKNTRGNYWVLDMKTKVLRALGGDAKPSTLMFAKFSPDASRVAFVRENDLYLQTLSDLAINPLTKDGSDTILNGTSDWVNEEELGLRDGFRWSPDGKYIVFWQFDTSEVPRISLIHQSEEKEQKITSFPYPTAGEKNSAVRLGIIAADGGEVRWLDVPGDPREHYLAKAEWTPDSNAVVLLQFNRLQNTVKVMRADPKTGATQLVLTENDEAWVENSNELLWINDDFLWLSERSGWRHAYRATLGGVLTPITKGEFDLIEVARVDGQGGTLDFIASPDNATQRYLYRVALDGSEAVRLTPADRRGTNRYDIAEDAKWAVFTHSSATTPPVIELISLPDHNTLRVLKPQTRLSERFAKVERPDIEFLRLDIGDGISLDASILRMPDLDLTRPHPLLVHVYGEPAGQTVRDTWGGQTMLWHAMLAQQGYVIASVDTRGTPGPRGRDWRKAIHRQLGILNAAEEAAAVRVLLERFPYLDPERVGIWGWSGGGSSSLDAIFRYPDLYRTAIAVAPVADRSLYDTIYEERYMGLPAENAEGYRLGSPLTHARHLQGDLLLIHGTGDDNVHYRGTEKLINELIARNKPFTVMPYPDRDHAINTGKGISRHLYELMTSWLREHLPVDGPDLR